MNKIETLIVCAGLDRVNRGGEVYARDLFSSLSRARRDVYLAKGGGQACYREIRLPCIGRHSPIAIAFGRAVGKSGQWVEYLTFFLSFLVLVVQRKPSNIYCIEPAMYQGLMRFRFLCRSSRLVTHSGFQGSQLPGDANTRFHYVTGLFTAGDGGVRIAAKSEIVVPHFLPCEIWRHIETADRRYLRKKLRDKFSVSQGHQVVISVGLLDNSIKRMGWIARELSSDPRKFFLMVGARCPETVELERICREFLHERFAIAEVSRGEVIDLLLGSDEYVSASLREGFGIANLEAAACQLPVVVHNIPEVRWVLGECAVYGDLTQDGILLSLISKAVSLRKSNHFTCEGLERFRESTVIPQFKELFA